MSGNERSFEAAKASLVGDRPENQDRCLFLSSPDTVLLALADGLGGHPRGEVAAQLLMDVTESRFRQASKPLADPTHFMLQCIGKTHHAILHFGRRQTPRVDPRTTAVLAVVQHGIAYWVHVGDSRLYLIRNARVIAQTRDHAEVRYVRQSATEAPRPRASLTRCLGGLPQPPTTTCGAPTLLDRDDALLLCSDGLWSQVPKQALVNAFDTCDASMDERLHGLLDLASTAPNSDNVTAVALRWLNSAERAADQTPLPDEPADAVLDRAIEHLENVLKKADETQ